MAVPTKYANLIGTAASQFKVGAGSADSSAALDVVSTTRGLLPPRMTTAQREAIATPAEGLVVFDTDLDDLYLYAAGVWGDLRNLEKWQGVADYGFEDNTETSISFNPATYTFTLTDIGGGWVYWRGGQRYSMTGNRTVVLPGTPPAAGVWFVYIDATNGSLTASTSVWTLLDTKVPVGVVLWDSTLTPQYFIQDERHTVQFPRMVHWYEHVFEGTRFKSGGILSGHTVTPSSPANTDNTFAISQATLSDEDLVHTLAALVDGDGVNPNYTVLHRTGASTWGWARSIMPYTYTASGYVQWDNAGTMTQGTVNSCLNWYLFFSCFEGDGRYLLIPGQAKYATANEAYAESVSSLDLTGLDLQEGDFVAQFTWELKNAYGTLGKCRLAREPVRLNVSLTGAAIGAGIVTHNNTAGIQGGSALERYHLTAETAERVENSTISSDLEMYVDGDVGDDANDGLSWGTAKKTLAFLYSESADALAREINADVTVNCRGAILAASSARHTYINGFWGTGSLTLKGTTALVESLTIDTFDNTVTNVGGRMHAGDSTKAWTVDEHRGRMLFIPSISTNAYPIASNTATTLRTPFASALTGTPAAEIHTLDAVLTAAVVGAPSVPVNFDSDFLVIADCSLTITFSYIDVGEVAVAGLHQLYVYRSASATVAFLCSVVRGFYAAEPVLLALSRTAIIQVYTYDTPAVDTGATCVLNNVCVVDATGARGMQGVAAFVGSSLSMYNVLFEGFYFQAQWFNALGTVGGIAWFRDTDLALDMGGELTAYGTWQFEDCGKCLSLSGRLSDLGGINAVQTGCTTEVYLGPTYEKSLADLSAGRLISNATSGGRVIPMKLTGLGYTMDPPDPVYVDAVIFDTEYYVDGDVGSDTNDGLSWATAKKTLSFLHSKAADAIPRVLRADVTVNVRGTVLSAGTEYHLWADGFVGAGGALSLVGELVEEVASITPTGGENSIAAIDYRTYIDVSTASWTVNEYRGMFIEFTSVHTSGIYYPIMRNTATRLESVNLPSITGTETFRIVSLPKLRAAQISDPTTLLEYTAHSWGVAFVTEGTALVSFRHLDMSEVNDAFGYIAKSRGQYNKGTAGLITNVQDSWGNTNGCAGYFLECYLPPGETYVSGWNFIRCNFNLVYYNYTVLREGATGAYFIGSVFDGADGDGLGIISYVSGCQLAVTACRFHNMLAGISGDAGSIFNIFPHTFFDNVVEAIRPTDSSIDFRSNSAVLGPVKFRSCTTAVNLIGNRLRSTVSDFSYITSGVTNELVLADSPTVISRTFAEVAAGASISNAVNGACVIYRADWSAAGSRAEYDATVSGLTSNTYQGAIDELASDSHEAVTLAASATLSGLGLTGQELSAQAASVSTNGYLTSTDWGTFNGKSTYADPLTTRGDVLYRNASNVTARLPVGTAGQVLRSDGTDVAWATPATSAGKYTTDFDNTDLSSGVLTVTHSLGSKFVVVAVYDSSDIQVSPDSVTVTNTTTCSVDLSSYGTISGTWNVVVVG